MDGGVCRGCGSVFRVGALLQSQKRRRSSVILPSVREIIPNRLAKMFRDPTYKDQRPCGLRYQGTKKR